MKKERERMVKQHVLYSAAFLLGLLLLLAIYIIYLQGFGADRLAHHPLNQRNALLKDIARQRFSAVPCSMRKGGRSRRAQRPRSEVIPWGLQWRR